MTGDIQYLTTKHYFTRVLLLQSKWLGQLMVAYISHLVKLVHWVWHLSLFWVIAHPLLITCDDNLADEPTSPSIDLMTCYVPAYALVSSYQASTMATLTSTSVSHTLSSIYPFVQLHSLDCSQSYLPNQNTDRPRSVCSILDLQCETLANIYVAKYKEFMLILICWYLCHTHLEVMCN